NEEREYLPKLSDEFLESIQPAYFRGGWRSVIRPVKWAQVPSTEECWLAQEELWVKRQLLKDLRKALDTAAAFPEGTDPNGAAQGGTAAVKFRNASGEIPLQLEPDEKNRIRVSGKSTIKNITPSRRTLSLATLRLRLQQGS